MRISHFAIHRPIFTIMVVLIVVLLGTISLLRLPIDLMPDISYPTLSVSCTYENAGPEEIEELITRPIEQAINAVPGVEEVTSVSTEGQGTVRVTFAWGTDLDAAANDIRDRLDRITDYLPEDAERPTLRKYDLASFPILILGASSNLDPVQTRQIIEDQVQYRLERVPGVAAVTIRGGLEREIHVSLDPAKINALAIPLEAIISRVREGNVNIPAGTIEKGNFEITIRTPGEYTDLKQLQDTVIAVRHGAPIQLREIAVVEDSWTKITRIVRVDGVPGMWLSINKQSGKNTVEVARAALAELERINRDIPQIKIIPIIDTSDYIRRSIANVGSSAIYGGLLAVLVLFLFLRNFRSTIVVATAIPVSIIATFAFLYFGGSTLNIMTLGGLALGIGMCVDSSIVVLENIYRMQEGGDPPLEAAIAGTNEVAAPIVAGALTTCVVFLPMIFIRGMSGIMFKQLAYVVSFANLCGLFVALTLIPMLSSRLIRLAKPAGPRSRKPAERAVMFFLRVSRGMEERYRELLHTALDHRYLVLGITVVLLVGSLFLIRLVGTEFMPATDEGEVRVEAEMQVGTRLNLLDEKFKVIEKIVNESVPEIKSTVTSVGGSRWHGSGGHTGDVRISLKPQSQRTRSSEQIAADLRGKLSKLPGMIVRTRAGQGLSVLRMGTSGADKVQVEVRGHDLQMADNLAAQVKEIVESVEGITDARVEPGVGQSRRACPHRSPESRRYEPDRFKYSQCASDYSVRHESRVLSAGRRRICNSC